MLLLLLLLLTVLACDSSTNDAAAEVPTTGDYAGSHDDFPVEDSDIQALQQLLNDKWTFFLYEMDKYNQVRDSATNDAMASKMAHTFADEYAFNAYWSDGAEFGDSQGTFSPLSWLEAQDVDSWKILHGTLLVPNYQHRRAGRLEFQGRFLLVEPAEGAALRVRRPRSADPLPLKTRGIASNYAGSSYVEF
ncbi:MAG: hypothetical protein ACI8S6_005148 [Myxococcota bacterium]